MTYDSLHLDADSPVDGSQGTTISNKNGVDKRIGSLRRIGENRRLLVRWQAVPVNDTEFVQETFDS